MPALSTTIQICIFLMHLIVVIVRRNLERTNENDGFKITALEYDLNIYIGLFGETINMCI